MTCPVRGGDVSAVIMVATAPVSVRSASLSPLTAWLLASGAKMDGVAVKWLGDSMGAGLIATRDLSPGTDVCAVPRSLLLSCTSGLSDPVLGSLLEDLQFELEDEANLYDASQGTISLQLLLDRFEVLGVFVVGEKADGDIYTVGGTDLVVLVPFVLEQGANAPINISYEAVLAGSTAAVGFSILFKLLVGGLERLGVWVNAPCNPERV